MPAPKQIQTITGEVEAVVIAKLDRLSRRMFDFTKVQAELQRLGVALVSIGEGFDDSTPIGRAMAHVIMTFAQMERELISERTRTAATYKRDHLQPYGPTPYGFRRVGDKLLPDRETLKVVEEIFTLRRKGASLRRIAGELNGRQIPAPRGGAWSAEGVRLILRNAGLYGKVLDGLLTRDEADQMKT